MRTPQELTINCIYYFYKLWRILRTNYLAYKLLYYWRIFCPPQGHISIFLDTDPRIRIRKEFYGSTTKTCYLTLSFSLFRSALKVEKIWFATVPVGLLDLLGCDLSAAVHASHRLAQPDETTDISIGRSTERINDL